MTRVTRSAINANITPRVRRGIVAALRAAIATEAGGDFTDTDIECAREALTWIQSIPVRRRVVAFTPAEAHAVVFALDNAAQDEMQNANEGLAKKMLSASSALKEARRLA